MCVCAYNTDTRLAISSALFCKNARPPSPFVIVTQRERMRAGETPVAKLAGELAGRHYLNGSRRLSNRGGEGDARQVRGE